MIKANELRLGNFVWDIVSGEWMVVDELGENIGATIINRDKYPLPDGWKMGPIPITSEVLKKFGFVCFDRSWRLDAFNIVENGRWVNGDPIEEIKYMVYKTGIGAIVEVKTLHHLQNLYFALTQEELNIKL